VTYAAHVFGGGFRYASNFSYKILSLLYQGAIIILGTRLIVSRSSFTYSDLPEGSIRLLNLDTIDPTGQLCCTLIEADQQKLPEYDAISYAWNDEQPTAPIICNGKRLLITPSLHEALRTLQSLQQPRPVWVDAICIKATMPRNQGKCL
jgi:hypothetical protein